MAWMTAQVIVGAPHRAVRAALAELPFRQRPRTRQDAGDALRYGGPELARRSQQFWVAGQILPALGGPGVVFRPCAGAGAVQQATRRAVSRGAPQPPQAATGHAFVQLRLSV